MVDNNCAYCVEGELVDKFGIKICELDATKVYLFKEQSHKGRVIVASKHHVSEMVELSEEERNAFFHDVNHVADVAKVARAIHKIFNPDKVNYGAYGDTGCHLHFHLVPKYREDAFEWGSTFAMDPKQKTLTDAEYDAVIAELKKYL